MISRVDTTNLSNMSVFSEDAYKPGTGADDYGDAALAKMFATLGTEERSEDGWKITKFNTTPLVS